MPDVGLERADAAPTAMSRRRVGLRERGDLDRIAELRSGSVRLPRSRRCRGTDIFAKPMVAEIVAMVGGEHDQCVLEQAALFHEVEEMAELIVDLLDQAHIAGDDRFADFVAREVSRIALLLEGCENRVRRETLASLRIAGWISALPYMSW